LTLPPAAALTVGALLAAPLDWAAAGGVAGPDCAAGAPELQAASSPAPLTSATPAQRRKNERRPRVSGPAEAFTKSKSVLTACSPTDVNQGQSTSGYTHLQ